MIPLSKKNESWNDWSESTGKFLSAIELDFAELAVNPQAGFE